MNKSEGTKRIDNNVFGQLATTTTIDNCNDNYNHNDDSENESNDANDPNGANAANDETVEGIPLTLLRVMTAKRPATYVYYPTFNNVSLGTGFLGLGGYLVFLHKLKKGFNKQYGLSILGKNSEL
jgi:hypothetical protein